MFQDVFGVFARLGLKKNDAKVYLACLKFTDGLFVHQIVKQLDIKRSTIDVILKRLVDAGTVNKVRVGNRYKYFAQSAESLLLKQEQALDDFKSILPALGRLGKETAGTQIRFFEGESGIREIYNDIYLSLRFAEGERKQLVSFVSGLETLSLYPDMGDRFVKKRIELGAWYRAIVPKSSTKAFLYAPHPESLRDIKAVDEAQFPFRATFETYADSVMIYSPTEPIGGVIIRNQKIADSMRSLFYLVWNMLPEEKTNSH